MNGKRPTVARVERVRRLLDEAHRALKEIEDPKTLVISSPLCRADIALVRWADRLRERE